MDRRLKQARRAYFSEPTLNNRLQYYRLKRYARHTNWVPSGVFSPDGIEILSASRDKTLRLWDRETGETIHILRGHTNVVFSGVYSPDGIEILSTSDDGTLRLWERP